MIEEQLTQINETLNQILVALTNKEAAASPKADLDKLVPPKAEAKPAPKAAPKPEPKAEKPAPKAEKPKEEVNFLDELKILARKALMVYGEKGRTAIIQKVLAPHNVNSLTELPEDKYQDAFAILSRIAENGVEDGE